MNSSFPETRISLVRRLSAPLAPDREAAWAALLGLYWPAVTAYARRRWGLSDADAEDAAQDVLAAAAAKGTLDGFDPARAKFRTFLRTLVDRRCAKLARTASAQKRGGGTAPLPLEAAEGTAGDRDHDEAFRREWVRAVVTEATQRFQADCAARGAAATWAVFERYDVIGPPPGGVHTYREVGEPLGLSESQVTNQLAAARRAVRTHILRVLREATGSEEEAQEEARLLLHRDRHAR